MSETKWTPGPWTLEPARHLDALEVRRAISTGNGYAAGDPLVVDLLWLRPNTEFQKAEANANLLTASPDLYAALEDMLWPISAGCQKPMIARCMCAKCVEDRARAALAKARGESQ